MTSMNLAVLPFKDPKKDEQGCLLMIEDITREKRMKATFSRYMNKQVADRLMEEGEDALGGRLQKATVLFSDLRSFTSLSERIGPQERTLTYLRDAARMVAGTRQPLLHYLTPPLGLVDTGLRFGTDELWLSPTSSDAIYIVQGSDVERWPLIEGTPTCR